MDEHVRCFKYDEDTHCKTLKDCLTECNVKDNKHCITLYKNSSGKMVPTAGGCMEKDEKFCPHHHVTEKECHLRFYRQVINVDTFSCCCTGDLCNYNNVFNETLMKKPPTTTTTTTLQTRLAPKNPEVNLMYYSVPPVICTFIIIMFFILMWKRHKRTMNRQEPLYHASPPTPVSTRPVHWDTIISHGQFGCVWRASWESNDAAIKIIQAHEKASWITEKTMYQNYSLVHDNILKFYSAEKRLSDNGMVQYWIVTQYHSNGSLNDYLRQHILNWDLMLKMMISIVNGLAFLHTENMNLTPVKPVIAHRDFKSRNILVKSNLECCLSDFGSACQFSDSTDNDDIKAQVGTKRYMAPEVLDGAIAFQADAFLNIDTYSLGLVMWELLSRCETENVIVDSHYRAPFEKEVGIHPTLDEMRTCVVDSRCRPKLKHEWRSTPEMEEVCNTIEECWDAEPDARLHAECVMARLKNIMFGLIYDGNQSDGSSGFIESSFMNDQIIEFSTETDFSTKEPLIVDLPNRDMEMSTEKPETNFSATKPLIVDLSSDQYPELSLETVETELSTREPLISDTSTGISC